MQGRPTTTDTTRTRYIAALGFSLSCHAAVLCALALVPEGSRREPPPIVVAVLGDAGASGGAAGSAGGAPGPAPEVAPAAPAPAAAAEPASARPEAPAPVRRSERRAERRRDVASRRDVDAPSGATAAAPASGASASVDSGSGVSGGGTAAGSGAYGVGRGAGSGGAGDGGDLRPWCSQCPTPEYPARARRQGWQGTVDVELHVGRDGAVEQASIGRSSGFAVLDAAAVTVARRSRFRIDVGSELHGQLRYRFVLEEAQDRPL